MIFIVYSIFIFYAFTILLALLTYILWYTLCTNVTLTFILTCCRHEVISFHIKSIDPNFCLCGRYKLASHPVDNAWHTAPQSPIQDWDPLPNNNNDNPAPEPAPDNN